MKAYILHNNKIIIEARKKKSKKKKNLEVVFYQNKNYT